MFGTSVRTSTMPLAPVPAEMAECRGVSEWASCWGGVSGHLGVTSAWVKSQGTQGAALTGRGHPGQGQALMGRGNPGQGAALTGRLTSQPRSHRARTTSRKPLCTATCSAVLWVLLMASARHPALRSTLAASGWFLTGEEVGEGGRRPGGWTHRLSPVRPHPRTHRLSPAGPLPGLTPGLRSAAPCCPRRPAGPRPPWLVAAAVSTPPGPGRQPLAERSCLGSWCPPAKSASR